MEVKHVIKVNNGLLIPIIVKTRVRFYRLSDFSKTNEKKILKKIIIDA